MDRTLLSPFFFSQLELAELALKTRYEYDEKNKPTKAKNRRIKARNAKLPEGDSRRKGLLRLPHPYPDWVTELFAKEAENHERRKHIPVEEWVHIIDHAPFPQAVRNTVGCYVNWDHFGDYTKEDLPENIDLFDKYFTRHKQQDPAVVAMCLHHCGYTVWKAYNRAKLPAKANRKRKARPVEEHLDPSKIIGAHSHAGNHIA